MGLIIDLWFNPLLFLFKYSYNYYVLFHCLFYLVFVSTIVHRKCLHDLVLLLLVVYICVLT